METNNLVDFITQNAKDLAETSGDNKLGDPNPLSKHSSGSHKNQGVSFQLFESTIQKLQLQIQQIELNYEVVETLRDSYIELESRVDNLEQLIHMDKNLFQLRHSYYQLKTSADEKQISSPPHTPSRQQHEHSTVKRNLTISHLEDGTQREAVGFRSISDQMQEELQLIKRDLKRDVGERFDEVERYIHRFLSQARDIDEKISQLSEKQKQNAEVIQYNEANTTHIMKQLESMKDEMIINQRPRKDIMVSPRKLESILQPDIEEMKIQVSKTDADILKIFRQIKKLLELDCVSNKLQTDVEQLKRQQNDHRVALKEIQRTIMFHQ